MRTQPEHSFEEDQDLKPLIGALRQAWIPRPPADLAGKVHQATADLLQGQSDPADAALEADLQRLMSPQPPAGLAQQVVLATADLLQGRKAGDHGWGPVLARLAPRSAARGLAAAAVLALALGASIWAGLFLASGHRPVDPSALAALEKAVMALEQALVAPADPIDTQILALAANVEEAAEESLSDDLEDVDEYMAEELHKDIFLIEAQLEWF